MGWGDFDGEPEEDARRGGDESIGAVREEWVACNPSSSVAAPHVRGLGQGKAPRHPAACQLVGARPVPPHSRAGMLPVARRACVAPRTEAIPPRAMTVVSSGSGPGSLG